MDNTQIIGIAGCATVGKDLFFKIASRILKVNGYTTTRLAFADAVKQDLDSFLKEKTGISSFTTNPVEKELIRPFIVSYSTNLMRKINPDVWIDKIKDLIDQTKFDGKHVLFMTDCRFENECNFLKYRYEGKIIHIKKYDIKDNDNKVFTPPVNDEEAANDPKVQSKADVTMEWPSVSSIPTYGGGGWDLTENRTLNDIVLKSLEELGFIGLKLV